MRKEYMRHPVSNNYYSTGIILFLCFSTWERRGLMRIQPVQKPCVKNCKTQENITYSLRVYSVLNHLKFYTQKLLTKSFNTVDTDI